MPCRLIWRIGNRTEEPDKNVIVLRRRRRRTLGLVVGELLASSLLQSWRWRTLVVVLVVDNTDASIFVEIRRNLAEI